MARFDEPRAGQRFGAFEPTREFKIRKDHEVDDTVIAAPAGPFRGQTLESFDRLRVKERLFSKR
jgi:hypothetical protein